MNRRERKARTLLKKINAAIDELNSMEYYVSIVGESIVVCDNTMDVKCGLNPRLCSLYSDGSTDDTNNTILGNIHYS